jgi:hypothetical protein
MKCLSKSLELQVESGALRIKSSNLVSENEMIYTNIEIVEPNPGGHTSTINVDAKRLSKFIACLNIPANVPILAKLVPSQMLHLSFVQDQILVYFVLPSVEE